MKNRAVAIVCDPSSSCYLLLYEINVANMCVGLWHLV